MSHLRRCGFYVGRVDSISKKNRQFSTISESSSMLKSLLNVVFISFIGEENGMKIILWIIAIIFIVGLLTLTGVFKLLF